MASLEEAPNDTQLQQLKGEYLRPPLVEVTKNPKSKTYCSPSSQHFRTAELSNFQPVGGQREPFLSGISHVHLLLSGRHSLSVRNVVRPDSTRSCSPASRPTTPSSYRPAGTPAPCHAFLRARLRNHHAHRSVILRPTRKPLYLDPTVDHGRSIGRRFPASEHLLSISFLSNILPTFESFPSTRSLPPLSTFLPPVVRRSPVWIPICFCKVFLHDSIVPGRTFSIFPVLLPPDSDIVSHDQILYFSI
jgi:hypothetical protein